MPQYVIELSDSPSECAEALDDVEPRSEDLLDGTYWSCVSRDHTGRVIVEAESESKAIEMVLPALRGKVRIMEVQAVIPDLAQSFDPEAVRPEAQEPNAS
ncbi:MAG TPA: hypothetical protein VMX94_06275 [Armatimonadota bacterium]|nr:hypothetical protein [Armatimonadota bacterium]